MLVNKRPTTWRSIATHLEINLVLIMRKTHVFGEDVIVLAGVAIKVFAPIQSNPHAVVPFRAHRRYLKWRLCHTRNPPLPEPQPSIQISKRSLSRYNLNVAPSSTNCEPKFRSRPSKRTAARGREVYPSRQT